MDKLPLFLGFGSFLAGMLSADLLRSFISRERKWSQYAACVFLAAGWSGLCFLLLASTRPSGDPRALGMLVALYAFCAFFMMHVRMKINERRVDK